MSAVKSNRWVASAFFACLAGTAQASLIQVSQPSNLGSGDSLISYADPDGTFYGDSATFTAGSNTLTVNGSELTRYEAGSDYFGTAYPTGTPVLFGFDSTGSTGPLSLSFANPVSEVGFNVESATYGPYNLNFTAFNGKQSLGSFEVSGDMSDLGFLGLDASGGDAITSVQLNSSFGYILALGPIHFANANSGQPSPVPEPASLGLLGLGLIGLVGSRRKTKRQ